MKNNIYFVRYRERYSGRYTFQVVLASSKPRVKELIKIPGKSIDVKYIKKINSNNEAIIIDQED